MVSNSSSTVSQGRPPHTASGELLPEIFKKSRGAFLAVTLFSFFVNVFILVFPLYMFQIYDRVLGSRNEMTLLMLFLICNFALLMQAALDTARSYVFIHVGSWLDREISGRILAASIALGLDRGRIGSTDVLRELGKLRLFLTGQAIYVLMDMPWVPIFIGLLFLLNFWLGVVAIFGSLLMLGLTIVNQVATKQSLRRAGAAAGRALQHAEQSVRSADIVEAMGMRQTMVRRWDQLNEESLVRQEEASKRGAIVAALSKYARLLVQVVMMSVAVMEMISPDSMLTGGAMMASIIIIGRALAPMEQAITSWEQMVAARAAYAAISKCLQDVQDRPVTSMALPRPSGRLTVENLTFHPRGVERPVLARVNFELAPGEVLGVIGPSAAGKSSLARFLVGIQAPSGGKVRLDGADVYSWSSDDLGQYIGYLPQDVELFSGTVRENISRFRDASSEAVIAAAEMAGLHEMILHLPKGYDSRLGPGGDVILSGGQRQRIGLARALFGNPALLVLDEPNANLDSAGDQALLDAIAKAKAAGATIVIIAHRPNVLTLVDRILVLQGGMVQRLATRDEVLPLLAAAQPAAVTGVAKRPTLPPKAV